MRKNAMGENAMGENAMRENAIMFPGIKSALMVALLLSNLAYGGDKKNNNGNRNGNGAGKTVSSNGTTLSIQEEIAFNKALENAGYGRTGKAASRKKTESDDAKKSLKDLNTFMAKNCKKRSHLSNSCIKGTAEQKALMKVRENIAKSKVKKRKSIQSNVNKKILTILEGDLDKIAKVRTLYRNTGHNSPTKNSEVISEINKISGCIEFIINIHKYTDVPNKFRTKCSTYFKTSKMNIRGIGEKILPFVSEHPTELGEVLEKCENLKGLTSGQKTAFKNNLFVTLQGKVSEKNRENSSARGCKGIKGIKGVQCLTMKGLQYYKRKKAISEREYNDFLRKQKRKFPSTIGGANASHTCETLKHRIIEFSNKLK